MRSFWVRFKAMSPLVLTRSSATVGSMETLDYIPGGALRGVVASKVYKELQQMGVSTCAFHRGLVRFGDARVAMKDDVGVPMPKSLHKKKGDDSSVPLHNAAIYPLETGVQWKQQRKGYVVGEWRVGVSTESSERTALQEGRARDGFLFGLQAIHEGQHFVARVDVHESVSDGVESLIRGALVGSVRVGRSRTAEFGQVHGELIHPPRALPMADSAPGGRVPILLTSDWWLIDSATGSTRLSLTPAMLGLPDRAFDVMADRTFLRFRTWSPFNGKRRRPDHERTVLEAGSVVTVQLRSGTTLQQLRKAVAKGVGGAVGEGLGRGLVAPCLLMKKTVRLGEWRAIKDAGEVDGLLLRDDALFAWARRRTSMKRASGEALALAEEWKRRLDSSFYAGHLSRSQWGRVRAVVQWSSPDEVLDAVERVVEGSGGANRLESAWGVWSTDGAVRLGAFFLGRLAGEADLMKRKESAQILCNLMVRRRQAEGGDP